MPIIAVAVAAIIGLAIGSFLNVVIYRLPRHESLLHPPSHCPRCGRPLRALENIPVVSWLALRGRCASCGAPIAARYPLVELLTGALFALSVLQFGVSAAGVAASVLSAFLIAVAFIDLDHLLIYDSLAIPAAVCGLAFGLVERRPIAALEGGAVFAGVLGAVYLLTAGRGLGLGDVKMAGAIGLYLGYPTALAAVVASFVIGAVLSLPVLWARRRGRGEAVPFGPFMVLAAFVAMYAPALLFGPAAAYQQFLIQHVFRH